MTLENASQASARFTTDQVTTSKTLTFQLQVSDGNASHTDTVNVTLTPAGANRAPAVTLAATLRVTEGDSVSITGTATDADGDTLTYSWAVGTLTGVTGTSTRGVSFTAPEVTADTDYTLTLTVTDDDATPLSTSASIVVTVADPGRDRHLRNHRSERVELHRLGVGLELHRGQPRRAPGDRLAGGVLDGRGAGGDRDDLADGLDPGEHRDRVRLEPQRVYYGGDEANHGTRRYRAAWYTKGANPTAGSPWSDVGANTCAGNQTPTANAGADQSVTVGASVTLDGSGSSDPTPVTR